MSDRTVIFIKDSSLIFLQSGWCVKALDIL